jgi:hypothetical protein
MTADNACHAWTTVEYRPSAGSGEDQLAGRAAVPGAVAEHHIHLLGFIEPHGDPVGERVPDGQHVLAGPCRVATTQ